jgi:hypothetical protein
MSQRLVVGLNDDAVADTLTAALQRLDVERVDPPRPELPGVLVVTVKPGADAASVRDDIARMDGIAYVEPETIYQAFGD